MEAITTHINADFDTIACMMAARKLYPDAVLVLPGSKEETVKGFLLHSALYSLEMKKLREIDLGIVRDGARRASASWRDYTCGCRAAGTSGRAKSLDSHGGRA